MAEIFRKLPHRDLGIMLNAAAIPLLLSSNNGWVKSFAIINFLTLLNFFFPIFSKIDFFLTFICKKGWSWYEFLHVNLLIYSSRPTVDEMIIKQSRIRRVQLSDLNRLIVSLRNKE